jgi:acyl-CoA synthetase (AMP-forming)/AMP-acid ligase II
MPYLHVSHGLNLHAIHPSIQPLLIALQVRECVVMGLPHEELGEVVAAMVVLDGPGAAAAPAAPQDGASSGASCPHAADAAAGAAGGGGSLAGLEQQLRAWCGEQMAPYQVPRVWRLQLEPLPRNAMGKVNKKALRQQWRDASEQEAQQQQR